MIIINCFLHSLCNHFKCTLYTCTTNTVFLLNYTHWSVNINDWLLTESQSEAAAGPKTTWFSVAHHQLHLFLNAHGLFSTWRVYYTSSCSGSYQSLETKFHVFKSRYSQHYFCIYFFVLFFIQHNNDLKSYRTVQKSTVLAVYIGIMGYV